MFRREWQDEDERGWRHRQNRLTVAGHTYRSEETLSHPRGRLGSRLVREVVRQMIDQRTQGIRSVYRNVL